MVQPPSPQPARSVRTLVIGYGNTLRQDDAAGPFVAEQVEAWALTGVKTRVVHQLTPELAADLAEVDRAVFVDARIATNPDEGVIVEPIKTAEPRWSAVGHTGNPGALLALATLAFGRSPSQAWLVTIPAFALELGEGFSPEATSAIPQALARIAAILDDSPTDS